MEHTRGRGTAVLMAGAIAAASLLFLVSRVPGVAHEKNALSVAFSRAGPLEQFMGDVGAPIATSESGRNEVPSQSPASEKSAASHSIDVDPLVAAKKDLAAFATDSVFGVMHIDAVMQHALTLASLPVEKYPDFESEDDEAIAYPIAGLPEGTKGHFLVGLRPYYEGESEYRFLQMEIEMPLAEPEYLEGAMREGPRMHFSISYDTVDPSTPVRFALMLQRRVDLTASRNIGIDAYTGQYTQGAYYWHDLLDETKAPFAMTYGIVNGSPCDLQSFPGASQLVGDVDLDSGLLNEVLIQLQKNFASIKGE